MTEHTGNTCFTPMQPLSKEWLPVVFALQDTGIPHPLCTQAAEYLQHRLAQQEWEHNFGLTENNDGAVIGKMFGVLVVVNDKYETGYLAAFSGKLGGKNHYEGFVPPVFDTLSDDGFLNEGMMKLSQISDKIAALEKADPLEYVSQIRQLKTERKKHSVSLQNEIFDHYHFLNIAGESKSLRELFENASYKNPPAGAGECAAPKLLQYAFQHNMKPLALAEFWWGASPKSNHWKHKHFYPCCKEKCEPILAHMLSGISKTDQGFR